MSGLSQALSYQQDVKVGVIDVWESPVGTVYDDTTGIWTYLGVIAPGSFKADFSRKIFDFKAGIPETIKASYPIDVNGKVSFTLVEMTSLVFKIAAGGVDPVRTYGANSTTVGGVANPTTQTASSAATTGGTIPAATWLFKYSFYNAYGETLPAPESAALVTTGTTNTITVTWPAIPAGATGVKVYGTSGAAGSETYWGSFTSGTANTFTAVPAASAVTPQIVNGTALVSSSGGSSQLLVVNGSGFAVGDWLEIQSVSTNGTPLVEATYVTAAAAGSITVQPMLAGTPLAATGTVKQIASDRVPVGTSTIRQKSYRVLFSATDGSQIVLHILQARADGVKPEFPQGKEAACPIALEAFGVVDNTLSPPQPVVAQAYYLPPNSGLKI